MSAFRTNIIVVSGTEQIGFGATLAADGSISAITGATLRYVTAAPTQTDNAGSLALRSNGTLYSTTGAGVWFPIGGGGSGWQLPDDVSGVWGTNAPGQVSSTYVSASNRWDLLGDSISQATAASGSDMRIATGSNVITGAVAGNASGVIQIRTGATDSTDAGGTGGNSGALTINTGNATSTLGVSGSSGLLTIATGNSDDANSGNIALTTGTAAGTRGSIECSALRVHTNDDIPFSVGTAVNDRFEFSYASGTTQGQIFGANITAGGATQATRPFVIATGTRTKNDNNAGVPATGAISISSGQALISFAGGGATGGVSGNVQVGTGATDSIVGANTGGNSGALGLSTGACVSTAGTSGSSGLILVNTGDSDDANTGAITVRTGNAAGVGGAINSGALSVQTGTVGGTGTTGSITITTGAAAGAGTSGSINLTPGTTVAGTRGQVVATGLRTLSSTASAITGATTLVLADSGGAFTISQAAAYTITLPTPPAAGVRFSFVVSVAAANQVDIACPGGVTFIGTIQNAVTSVITATGAGAIIRIIASANVGDNVEIVSVSAILYYVKGTCQTAGKMTAP